MSACAQIIPARDTVVELTAATHITLAWDAEANATSLSVWRRLPGATAWTLLADLATSAPSYADVTALPGTLYEYRVKRFAPSNSHNIWISFLGQISATGLLFIAAFGFS